jgi:hypothetical protein
MLDAWRAAKLTADRLGWVFANYRIVDAYFVDISRNMLPSGHDNGLIEDMIAQDLGMARSAMILDRAAVLDVGGFDPQLRGHRDDDLCLRMVLNGYRGFSLASECASCRTFVQGGVQADLDSGEVFLRKWSAQIFADPQTQLNLRANLKRRMSKFFEPFALQDGFRQIDLQDLDRDEAAE